MSNEHKAKVGAQPDEYAQTAQYYDLLYHDKAPKDLPLYRELAQRQDGDVLELGCGTGRIALNLARAGFQITGLDASPAMLAQFREKLAKAKSEVRERVTLVEGDMERFSLPQHFKLAIAPFRAFQHLLTAEAQQSCLECIYAHLADGGLYVHNVFNPNMAVIIDRSRQGKVWQQDQDVTDTRSGRRLRRYHQLEYELARQVMHIEWRYELFGAGGELLSTTVEQTSLRWQFRFEAEHLLQLCGFEIVEAYGGYDKRPLDDQAGELIYICRRNGET